MLFEIKHTTLASSLEAGCDEMGGEGLARTALTSVVAV
jgi:hypothetical protein